MEKDIKQMKEDIAQIKKDIVHTKVSMDHFYKMLSDFVMSVGNKSQDTGVVDMLKELKGVMKNDPHLAKRPDILGAVSKLFEVMP